MANDLATLRGKLETALRDSGDDAVWASAEKEDLINWAVRSLWPRFSRPLDPESTTITVVADDYYYSLPSGVVAVSRIDRYDSDGDDYGAIHGRAWEIVGDVLNGTGKLHIGRSVATADDVLHLHGYGRYDTTTNYIPDDFVPLVLAKARAEAYRRVAADRARFKVWLSRNQTQNMTVNELLQQINEADAEVQRLMALTPKTWQKPVAGRVG